MKWFSTFKRSKKSKNQNTIASGTKVRSIGNELYGIVKYGNKNNIFVMWYLNGKPDPWTTVHSKKYLVKVTDQEWDTHINDAKMQNLLK